MKKDPNVYPPGLNAAKVRKIVEYYDRQTDDEAAAEIENAELAEPGAWIRVPLDLLPRIEKMIAGHRKLA